MVSQAFIRLRMELGGEVPEPVWPCGVELVLFEPEQHAAEIHGLLVSGYRNGGGEVAGFAAWWEGVSGDEEYDPGLVFLAADASGRLVGVAHCWTSAFLKDLAVREDWRRRGIGRALMCHAFHYFQARDHRGFELKVRRDNPSGAERLYRALGMTPAG
jgi:ribosomal protein S18 acetylase RimI-like enzyme